MIYMGIQEGLYHNNNNNIHLYSAFCLSDPKHFTISKYLENK